jgi:cysteine desulfurase
MWVNNETGVIQPIEEIAYACAAEGVPFHTDMVQAFGKLPTSLGKLPVSFATISGHKLGAPKGIGALIARDRDRLSPLIHGGGQQGGLRPGTENIAAAVGLGRAAVLAVRSRLPKRSAWRRSGQSCCVGYGEHSRRWWWRARRPPGRRIS